ncbi:hypothetical protein N7471_010786 [Penicillium samsonianum]|uniref:uncharacterized protein n=1 Tax=Penicillium samsonianum TaxID=1882272 RepID=UPI00254874F5|nr:uncharacterized protein N7471_010786 [Penicillium samsonianum]KAJ6126293.1 hypothetical protein N7471_010786 [Penicillium samsonianum]
MSLAPLSPADQDFENLSPVDQDFENLFDMEQPTKKDRNAILNHFKNTLDINIPPKPYNTALEAASHIGSSVLVKRLLEENPNRNPTTSEPDRYGNALLLAISGKCPKTVKLLLDHGADLQFRKKCKGEYRSPLDVAFKEGYKEIAKELFKRLEKPQYRGTEVHRALCMASENGNRDQVKALLRKVTDVNYQDDAYGPALVHAARGGNTEVVKTLLNNGARVNMESYHFGSPLTAAIEERNPEMVELLLRSNAIVDLSETKNPLLCAAKEGNLKIVELLIDRGAQVNIEGYKYGTPLFAAALYKEKDVALYLLEKGAKVDIAIKAARRGHWSLPVREVGELLKAWESSKHKMNCEEGHSSGNRRSKRLREMSRVLKSQR